MNQSSKKLTVPDLISVGVFTAIYFVLVTIATFACAILPGIGNIILPAAAALISGSVYMLLALKLQKFGGISIMGLVMGLFFFVSGHFVRCRFCGREGCYFESEKQHAFRERENSKRRARGEN